MTRDHTKEILPIIKAFAEGKTIQYLNLDKKWVDIETSNFNDEPSRYRIKPEPKYRPFKNTDECWDEMQKHQPFGWVESIESENFEQITCIGPIVVRFSDKNLYFSAAFNNYKFVDGSPFGIKEE